MTLHGQNDPERVHNKKQRKQANKSISKTKYARNVPWSADPKQKGFQLLYELSAADVLSEVKQ